MPRAVDYQLKPRCEVVTHTNQWQCRRRAKRQIVNVHGDNMHACGPHAKELAQPLRVIQDLAHYAGIR